MIRFKLTTSYEAYSMIDLRGVDKDLTQAYIGKLYNTTQQQYYKYEKGIQEIPVHHLIALAKLYGISIGI